MLNGKRWEEFIQMHLPHLTKFEFFFKEYDWTGSTSTDIELIMAPFQTPFWIEHKKWFVTCEFYINDRSVHLYSLPICTPSLQYLRQYDYFSLSTHFMRINENPAMMNNVQSLTLSLDKPLPNHIQERVCPIYYQTRKFLFLTIIRN
jgi:hypothetical protein